MKKLYTIEVEENKAEIVASLLAQINVKISMSPKEKRIKLYASWCDEENYLELTEDQYRLFKWLSENCWLDPDVCFDENPTFEFKRI